MTAFIPADHPALAGHFPGRPVVPGVVLLDAVHAALEAHLGRPARLTGIPSVKFTRPVAPGEGFDCRFQAKEDGRFTFTVISVTGMTCAAGSVTVESGKP